MKLTRPLSFPYKWELILLLWLAFIFNQADRQIFNVVLPALYAGIIVNGIWQAGSSISSAGESLSTWSERVVLSFPLSLDYD